MDRNSISIIRPIAYIIFVSFLLFCILLESTAQAEKQSVELKNGRVTIHSENIRFMNLLEEMVDELGIELFLAIPPDNKPVTFDMTQVSISEAIRRVLKGYDYAVVYLNQTNKKTAKGLVLIPMHSQPDKMSVSLEDPIVNFDENFWQTFTPHKYLGGYNIIFTTQVFGQQKEPQKEIIISDFIKAYEDRIKLIQEELNEGYAEKEFTRWVVARAKQELEFYKNQLQMMSEE